MLKELRVKLDSPMLSKLDLLRDYWGYRVRGDALAHLITEAHDRHLSRTHWPQQQAHAWRVLKRLKPEVLLAIDEVVGVSFLDGGDRVCIHVALNAAPYQVSRREWEK